VSAPVIDDVGVRPADLRPDRAIALVVLSRVTLVLMVALAAWAVHVALSGPSGPDTLAVPRATVVLDSAGTDHASLLEGVLASVRGTGGRVVDLDIGAHVERRAPVRMRVVLPAGGAGEVDRLVRRVVASGLEDVTAQGVTPVAGGVVVEMAATIRLRGTGTAAVGAVVGAGTAVETGTDPRAGLVVLSEVVERSGVRLRRLELLGDGSGVRVDVAGVTDELVALVATLERSHSSPLDFRSVRLRAGADGVADLDLLFALRSAAPGGMATGAGVQG
jgi:hypothetical protein